MTRIESDVLISGGGIAGLVLANALGQEGLKVIVLEASEYPRHRVCGEFISTEVLPYLHSLDLPIDSLSPVRINTFELSSTGNRKLKTHLDMEALGLSRYALDLFLKEQAEQKGVKVIENTEVLRHQCEDHLNLITDKKGQEYAAPWFVSAHGKRSRLDTYFNRPFLTDTQLYSGIKMHFEGQWEQNTVALHNFKGGYAGISAVEGGRINVCYLVKTPELQAAGGLQPFQEKVMQKNQALLSFFKTHQPVFESPVAISGIRFGKKQSVQDSIPFVGDATGLVAPLFGNGMALAVRTAHLLHGAMRSVEFKNEQKPQALKAYQAAWNTEVKGRLALSRIVQNLFGRPGISDLALMGAKALPFALRYVLAQSHGKPILPYA
jgi:menaquinone-9 beta-reductase